MRSFSPVATRNSINFEGFDRRPPDLCECNFVTRRCMCALASALCHFSTSLIFSLISSPIVILCAPIPIKTDHRHHLFLRRIRLLDQLYGFAAVPILSWGAQMRYTQPPPLLLLRPSKRSSSASSTHRSVVPSRTHKIKRNALPGYKSQCG